MSRRGPKRVTKWLCNGCLYHHTTHWEANAHRGTTHVCNAPGVKSDYDPTNGEQRVFGGHRARVVRQSDFGTGETEAPPECPLEPGT